MDVNDNLCKEVIDLFSREAFLYFTSEYDLACKKYNKISQFRREERFYYPPYKFQTPNGFNFVINFFTRARKEPVLENTGDMVYAWYRHKGYTYVICTHQMCDYSSSAHISIFIPHFFYRFRDRYLHKPQMKFLDVVQHFFLKNYREGIVYTPSKKHPNNIYINSNEGAYFADLSNSDFIKYKTFISWEMRFPDQIKISEEMKRSAAEHGFDMAIPDDEFDDYN